MKTVVKEKVVSINYELNENYVLDGEKKVFTKKPAIVEKKEVIGYQDICAFEGDFRYNSTFYSWINFSIDRRQTLNISEDKEVKVEKEIFRADLNELHLITTEEVIACSNKEQVEEWLDELIKEFNKQMIESDEKLLVYCKLHKLNVEETDVDELFKLVYPNKTYSIKDGKIVISDERNYYLIAGDICNATSVTRYDNADRLHISSAITEKAAIEDGICTAIC